MACDRGSMARMGFDPDTKIGGASGRFPSTQHSAVEAARWGEGPERQRVMTLAPNEFIRRFLLHVLPHGFHRIRHYGLLASSTRKAEIARARELLAGAPAPSEPETVEASQPLDWLPPCPCCGGRMRIIETFERWMQPRAPPHAPAATETPS